MATHKDSQFTPASQPDQGAVLKRRDFLKTAAGLAGVAALSSGVVPGMSGRAFGAGAALETRSAKLGFIALTDAAPLFVAVEKGFFAKHGMTGVSVEKQSSWGTTRDNLVLGSARNGIDGAHILTPMPYLMTAGVITTNNIPTPMYILGRLNVAGQGISVSNEYLDLKVGTDTTEFAKAIAAKRAGGKEVRAAVTFPGGTHDLWMRYWLAAGGINPDSAIATITVPPPQMVANMKVGSMDTFCVGAPWNAQLINQKIGYTAVTTGEIWHNHPEKAFAMRADYVDRNPNASKALLKAIQEAQIYCDQPENIAEVAEICARRRWINAPVGDLVDRMRGHYDYGTGRVVSDSPHKMRFWDDHASYPFKSHDTWFLTENIRWGYLPASTDTAALVDKVNREELWRLAALELGVSETQIPSGTSRGIETFFDGTVFDPENPQAYLDSLAIKRPA
jgi:nitrate/nitrite transport system substrate-binding protein